MKNINKILIIETNIDDCSPEILAHTMDLLLQLGVNDVFFENIYMKKNRPAVKLTVLCEKDKLNFAKDIIFQETSTIGIRIREEERVCLNREIDVIQTKYGNIRIKRASHKGLEKVSIEFEDARKISEKYKIPIRVIYDETFQMLQKIHNDENCNN